MEIQHQLSDSVVYRRVSPTELLLVEIESGKLYYFNPETEGLLDFFREPAPLSGSGELANLCEFLREKGILREVRSGNTRRVRLKPRLKGIPRLLREGEADLRAMAVGLEGSTFEGPP